MTNQEVISILQEIKVYSVKKFDALQLAIKSSCDMEEIKEIMECDTDAETKCKMICEVLKKEKAND